jgi:hypothetical protein
VRPGRPVRHRGGTHVAGRASSANAREARGCGRSGEEAPQRLVASAGRTVAPPLAPRRNFRARLKSHRHERSRRRPKSHCFQPTGRHRRGILDPRERKITGGSEDQEGDEVARKGAASRLSDLPVPSVRASFMDRIPCSQSRSGFSPMAARSRFLQPSRLRYDAIDPRVSCWGSSGGAAPPPRGAIGPLCGESGAERAKRVEAERSAQGHLGYQHKPS